MSRFVVAKRMIGSLEVAIDINVDMVRGFWRVLGKKGILRVQLDNGETVDVLDGDSMIERLLEGREHIVQVFPVVHPLYATYKGDEKSDIERPIRYMGLCANGEVRPLELCSDGLCFADDVDDFIRLHEGEGDKMTKRQVNALEGIDDKLGSISNSLLDASVAIGSMDKNLDNCTSVYKGDDFLRITGDVYTN